MKKIFLSIATILMIALFTTLVACTNTTTTAKPTEKPTTTVEDKTTTKEDVTTTEKEVTTTVEEATTTEEDATTEAGYAFYTINVYDVDGELLGTKNLSTENYPTVLDALNNQFTTVSSQTTYGTSISSINGSIVDANWYLALYENGEYASTTVDGLVINDGDVFDFKSECWNTKASGYGAFDEYDVLVDKIIYHYAKTYMQDMIKADTTFSSSDYWTYMAINMMANNGYDKSVFNANVATEELKESLKVTDFSSFKQADWGKYYYTAKVVDELSEEFLTAYKNHVETALPEEFGAYGEYSIPFEIAPAAALDYKSNNLSAIVATDYKASTEYGLDGLAWQVTALQLFDKYDKTILSDFPIAEQANGTSTAIILMVYAAMNESARGESADLIKILLDKYYDETLKLVKVELEDDKVNYSTNQIYAALMAYKAARDNVKAVNLFA